ncbi:chemotaxis protein CheW [Sphingomonas aracearum]|uniref:Chemotaxis protein CheW n=1 Tax=Sphingomonas aracearum TaxID=2283317 RepID=A0A369VUK3_9SPHN|nr:chemotaxis protein CheW [Sphingomonas aracearum]RDE05227.1 chemotaxis protein CheW [Sphingomonas aracearum]
MNALFLIARLGGRNVAIESAQVESVVDIGAVVPVPGAQAEVRGLAALRSRVVTVIDARVALGLPPLADAGGRAVITAVDGHHYAVLVDALDDVAPFTLEPLSPGIALDHGWRLAGCGIVEREGEPILAIELRSLIPQTAVAA